MNHRFHYACIAFLTSTVFAADQPAQRTDEQILKSVTLPDGYTATVFASPPLLGYPTSVSAAIDGTIFVAVDENGSLGRDRNSAERKPGKVVRMRDTDGDGKADEFKVFAEMESPRGVIWDGPSGTAPGTLYVMHPPNLTAYTDTDGDGVADKQEDILTGLGFDLGFRGADHTTNGCRLAIDGFIYIAVGDYGFINARARDGTTLTNRGGGIVRIRPDGTGFEIVSRGQRNIYDVAVSPTLDLFTRDNTNDGGGWDVRLSFVPPGANLGYPTLFKNFPEDMLQPLADYGGGSPCGALWIDEPGLQNGLYTVEWGRNAIMYHKLKPKGAGWETDGPNQGQTEWLKLTRPTDMDVDASGAIFITSWEGATFNYNGPNAGYVLRVVKKNKAKMDVPDLEKATPEELGGLLFSDSATLRLAAGRELHARVRAPDAKPIVGLALRAPSNSFSGSKYFGEVATVCELLRVKPSLARTAPRLSYTQGSLTKSDPDYRIGLFFCYGSGVYPHDANVAAGEYSLMDGLRDANPHVRTAAIVALRRLGKADAAPSILPLVADPDPIVSHLAIRALSELKAVQPCLAALDSAMGGTGVPPVGSGVPPEPSRDAASRAAVADGALRALYGMPAAEVVDGLIQRLGRTSEAPDGTPAATGGTPVPPTASLRRGILNALCRLANQDAPYTDPKVWWGTRPDTSGPVYQAIAWSETDKITAALKQALDTSSGSPAHQPPLVPSATSEDDARWLITRMYQTKVAFPGLVELMLAKAGNDTPANLTAIEGMIRNDNSMPPEAIAALQSITGDNQQPPELRVRALRLFQRCAENGGVFPGAMVAFSPLAGHDLGDAKLTAVFEDFTRDGKNGKWVGDYAKALAANDAPKRQLAAIVLVNLSTGRVGSEQERERAQKAVDKGFATPESAAALLTAIARTGAKPFAEQVKANLNNPNNAVAEAALFAYQKLGLKDTGAPMQQIGTMKYDDIFAAVQKGGDAKAGQEMYLRAGCIACHTINADEPPKGPILSAVTKIYDRAALTESILKPNAKIAQGFESAFFKTKKGEQVEGFVTREGGDSVDVRNIVGQTVTLEKSEITERGHRPQSMMPEGLLNAFTPTELANLLAYLESLKK